MAPLTPPSPRLLSYRLLSLALFLSAALAAADATLLLPIEKTTLPPGRDDLDLDSGVVDLHIRRGRLNDARPAQRPVARTEEGKRE